MLNMEVINFIKGLIFCCLWYFSIFFGFITLYCSLLPVLLFSNYGFRACTDKIFAFWELYPTALLQLLFGTKIYVHGDYVDPDETSLIVTNHRTRVDWNYLWLCMYHATEKPKNNFKDKSKFDTVQNGKWVHQNGGFYTSNNSYKATRNTKKFPFDILQKLNQHHRLKYVLKDEIRHIPGPGWVMQMNCFTYIRRNWEHDEAEIVRVANYLDNLNYTYQLLIFPEGTDLTEQSMKKSDSFAKKNNLMPYKQVLHPRTRGFISLVQSLQPRLASVYDITVGYSKFNKWRPDDNVGSCCLKDMICGHFPEEVHFSIKRYPAEDLPEDSTSLADWLNEVWKEKETELDSFYKNGRFVKATNRLYRYKRGELAIALVFWSSLVIMCFYLLYFHHVFRWILLAYCLLFILLNCVTEGFHHLEIGYYDLKYGRKRM